MYIKGKDRSEEKFNQALRERERDVKEAKLHVPPAGTHV